MKLFDFSKPYQTIRASIMVALCLLLAGLLFMPVTAGADEKNPLADLKIGSHAALLRHALAPGVGDPEKFSLGDCTSQRNLSAAGRRQAAEIGLKFREAGLVDAELYTSQWCRCIETARLMGLGEPAELPVLNSFFRDYSRQQSQTEQLIDWLSSKDLSRPVILVTHQVNITALTGVYPESGEIVLIRRKANGSFEVTAKIQTGYTP